MKKLLFCFLSVLLVCSCNNNGAKSDTDKDTLETTNKGIDTFEIEEVDTSEIKATVEKRVNEIYSHVFSEYVKDWEYHPEISRETFDTLYLSEDFYNLINQVENVAEKLNELIIDCDYWVMAQDYGNNLTHKVLSVDVKSSKEATALINIHNFESDDELTVELIFERGNWYIDNWKTMNVDWKKSLISDLKKYNIEYKPLSK